MPISLICGACDAALTAPDAAAGKRVKCKKCGAILDVPLPDTGSDPDFEVIEEAPTMMMPPIKKPTPPAPAKAPPPPAAAKPKPKPVMLEVDDDEDDRPAPKKTPKPVTRDDDEGEDDRPAPKKPVKKRAIVEDDEDDYENDPRPKKGKKGKAKKKAGSNLPLLVGGGLVGVAVAGFLVWYLAIREPELTLKTPPAGPQDSGEKGGKGPAPLGPGGGGGMPGGGGGGGIPAGWQEFKKPEFTAAVNTAGQPQTQSLPVLPGVQSGTAYAFRTQNPNGAQVVTVVTLDPLGTTAAQQDPNKMLESMFTGGANKGGGAITSRSDSQLDGKPARDATMQSGGKKMFLRGAIVGNRVYVLLAGGDGVNSVEDEQVKTFFDSFKITGQ